MKRTIKFLFLTALAAMLAFASCGSDGGDDDGDDEGVKPAAPEAAVITEGDGQLLLSWDAVEGATAYEVWFHTADDSSAADQSGGDIVETTYILSGLTNGATYYMWLKAKNSAGVSEFGPVASGIPQQDIINVEFISVTETGGVSGTADSTGLTLTFDVDPAALTADDITVTGATKGALSGTGATRTLAISDITVGNGETVTVEIASPSGYSISGSPLTAVVYRALYIGMAYQGGVIAYILQDGDPGYVSDETHGLIASAADLSAGIQWYNGSSVATGATGTILGTGQTNTTTIINIQGSGNYAASLCDDYTNTDMGTGVYSDWYLPSKDELNKLYLSKTSIGGFNNRLLYWSSSEGMTVAAWAQNFGNGNQNQTNKGDPRCVRAVRYF